MKRQRKPADPPTCHLLPPRVDSRHSHPRTTPHDCTPLAIPSIHLAFAQAPPADIKPQLEVTIAELKADSK